MSNDGQKISIEQYEQMTPTCSITYEGHTAIFCTPSRRTNWRVKTFFTKEPDTIAWISGFDSGDVFVDIGANVGTYAIWAGRTRGVQVYAFEPESQNYALLCKNIVLNNLSDKVLAYCLAMSDEVSFSRLYLSRFAAGEADHSFGTQVDACLQPVKKSFSQGCFSTTLDKLVEIGAIPVPTHIKLDVDGFEHKVIAGAAKTLVNDAVKSILVEINPYITEHREVVGWLVSKGFSYSEDQVRESTRKDGVPLANYIFRR